MSARAATFLGPVEGELTDGEQMILASISKLRCEVKEIADQLKKQQDRKKYHAEYYQKRKAKEAKKKKEKQVDDNRLTNHNKHCLEGSRDKRLPFAEWAKVLKQFVDRGLSAYNFMTWLSWTWNHNTFRHVPITKSGGYMNVFIGMSGDKPLRHKYSERDVTGRVRVRTFKTPVQLEPLGQALWWHWGYAVLMQVVSEVADEPWYEKLGDAWHRPMQVMQGAFGCYQIREGLIFDPTETDLVLATKGYQAMRPTLECGWGACLKGLSCKEEPFIAPKL